MVLVVLAPRNAPGRGARHLRAMRKRMRLGGQECCWHTVGLLARFASLRAARECISWRSGTRLMHQQGLRNCLHTCGL